MEFLSCTLYYSKNFTCKSILCVKCMEYHRRSNTLYLVTHLSSQLQEGSSNIVLHFNREKESMNLDLEEAVPQSGRKMHGNSQVPF